MSSQNTRDDRQKELAIRIQSGETDLLAELWQSVERLVAAKVQRVLTAQGNGNRIEFDDLYNSGFLALCAACESYRPEMGHFVPWFLRYLKSAFAEATGYRTRRGRHDPLRNAVSLSTPVGEAGNGAELGDLIADSTAEEPIERVEDEVWCGELRKAIFAAMAEMPPDEAETLHSRYWDGLTLEQVAKKRGIWPTTVQQQEKRAIRRIRRRQWRKLAHFYYFDFYQSTGKQAFFQTGMSVQERYVIGWENIIEAKAADSAQFWRYNGQINRYETRKEVAEK